jgi:drug/metabolite transporter (DMT)-like permease
MEAARRKRELQGLAWGFIGVAIFSLTLPATRVAVVELDPVLVGLGRSLAASVLAALVLLITRQPLPRRDQILRMILTASGVVLGFPLITAYAMRYLPSAHGAIVIGLLPLATAAIVALSGRERPSRGFWFAAGFGALLVVAFALIEGGGTLHLADLALLLAVAVGALGYAEGARLTREMPGWVVISWVLVVSVPFLLPPVLWSAAEHGINASVTAWLCFAYVSLFSQYLGFFPWYHGLALGGVARVSQVQLTQPFLTLIASALLLGEKVSMGMIIFAAAVVATVAIGRKMPIRPLK